MTVVTAADAPYFRTLWQLLSSLSRHEPLLAVRAYDLGLTAPQRECLARTFPRVQLVTFPLVDYPAWFRPSLRTCAWKPLVLQHALGDGDLLWLDAGTLVLSPLQALARQLAATGVYAPYAGRGCVRDWTHPATLRALDVPVWLQQRRNRAGGVIGLSSSLRPLVDQWAAWAHQEELLCPAGSSRANHRFDQSLWNVLLYTWAEREHVRLTEDELDIGSSRPLPQLTARCVLPGWFPLGLQGLAELYFRLRRQLDIRLPKR